MHNRLPSPDHDPLETLGAVAAYDRAGFLKGSAALGRVPKEVMERLSSALLLASVCAFACLGSPHLEAAEVMKPGSVFRDCPDCPEMTVVPAGSFMMGASTNEEVAGQREDQVLVNIASPFAVGRFAVTRGEFAVFSAAAGHNIDGRCYDLSSSETKPTADRDWRSPGFSQTDRHPVVCVNWNDAKAYVAWLVSSTGKRYRLLTETEREYVTRAGSTTPFWWGRTISTNQANYDGNITYAGGSTGERRGGTVPVDSFPANPWGLYNVHGNAWDWTEDWWNPANTGNLGDGGPRLTGDCSIRVIRGAGWNNAPHTLRSARRDKEAINARVSRMSFRVARTLQ
jgi:formylglycine-generating enzyme required for sulfatase activity